MIDMQDLTDEGIERGKEKISELRLDTLIAGDVIHNLADPRPADRRIHAVGKVLIARPGVTDQGTSQFFIDSSLRFLHNCLPLVSVL